MKGTPTTQLNKGSQPRTTARRFRSMFCRFHAIGAVTRGPEYNNSRRGQAAATLSIMTTEGRDLELIVFDRDHTTLRARLEGVTTGAKVYAEGTVQAPRIDRRELPQFFAEVIFHTARNGTIDISSPQPGTAHP
jgi:hypothetical protein